MVVECLRFELARGRFDDKGATMEASACIGVKLHVGVLPVTSHEDRRQRACGKPNRPCHAKARCSGPGYGYQYASGVPSVPPSKLGSQRDGRPAQVVDVTLRPRFVFELCAPRRCHASDHGASGIQNASGSILRARPPHSCRAPEKHDEFAPCSHSDGPRIIRRQPLSWDGVRPKALAGNNDPDVL
jgi:hypothetical protein